MTKIYLIRHGQTNWNRDKLFRGRADMPLNNHGRKEAEALAKHLEGVAATACYASPLSRAFETAEIVARPHKLDVIADENLIDIDYGEWQGLSEAAVKKKYPEIYLRWHERPQRTRFPEGESLSMVRKRAMKSLQDMQVQNPNGMVFVVAHRVVTKVIMCAMLGLDNRSFWKIRQDNCAFNIVELAESGPIVVTVNDTCHMKTAGIAPKLGDF